MKGLLSMLMDYGSHDARVSYASEEKSYVGALFLLSISQDNNGGIYT